MVGSGAARFGAIALALTLTFASRSVPDLCTSKVNKGSFSSLRLPRSILPGRMLRRKFSPARSCSGYTPIFTSLTGRRSRLLGTWCVGILAVILPDCLGVLAMIPTIHCGRHRLGFCKLQVHVRQRQLLQFLL